MIEEPPLLQIRKPNRRPTAEQLDALRTTPTGFLCDAMDGRGAIDPSLFHLDVDNLPVNFCGVALTCEPGPDDILALAACLTMVRPGDVVVSYTRNWRGSAAAGDRVLGMMKNGGAVGFVTDGMVRDHEGIVPVGLPVVCAGLNPNSPYSKGPGKIGEPVLIGGVTIETGDVIVADRSGTVVVPYARIDPVIEAVRKVEALEEELDAKVADGLTHSPKMDELLATDKVRWL